MSKVTSSGMLAATMGILAAGGGLPLEVMPRMRQTPLPTEATEFDEERIRKAEDKQARKAAKRLKERQND